MKQVVNNRTKIIATIGPSSSDYEILREMVIKGVDVVRLNFSHGSHKDHKKVISNVREISDELGVPMPSAANNQFLEINIKMIAWDTTQIYGYLNKKNFEDLEKINTTLSRFAIKIQQKGLEYYKIKYNEHKIDLADPLAMTVMINDKETNYKRCNIKIILDGDERGKDIINFNKNGNIKLVTQVSRTNFLNTLKKSLV